VAWYLLAFGGVVFCCVSSHPDGSHWQPERLFYGLLPMGASAVTFAFAFRLLVRSYLRRRNAWLVGCVVVAFVAVLDFTVFLNYRKRQDEQIKLIWSSESDVFNWGSGEVKLPVGFTYKADHGFDTYMGHFTSQDGKVVIEHDIGELAGEHLGMGGAETLVNGSRVRVGLAVRPDGTGPNTFFSKVSFPDSGCANFYTESTNEGDAAVIEFIAKSFRPSGWAPSWARPLLPELIRSDCRHALSRTGF